jgi:phosphatidylserine/phosphatidylglycerophosphate/cardiolipin synthase-like enzyme
MRWKRKQVKKRDLYASQSWGRYCAYPQTMESGNVVELLVDGTQAYPAMLREIAGAKSTILMDSYIFNDDEVGRLFSSALCDAAKRGVLVYLIVDGVGTRHVSSNFFENMCQRNLSMKMRHLRQQFNVAPVRYLLTPAC